MGDRTHPWRGQFLEDQFLKRIALLTLLTFSADIFILNMFKKWHYQIPKYHFVDNVYHKAYHNAICYKPTYYTGGNIKRNDCELTERSFLFILSPGFVSNINKEIPLRNKVKFCIYEIPTELKY